MTICGACGFRNRDGARFCAGCAGTLEPPEQSLSELAGEETGQAPPNPVQTGPDPDMSRSPASAEAGHLVGTTVCGRCGATNQPDARFCFECGGALSVPSVAGPATAGAPTLVRPAVGSTETPLVSPSQPERRRRRWLPAAIIATAVVLGGVLGTIAWWLVGGSESDHSDDAVASPTAEPTESSAPPEQEPAAGREDEVHPTAVANTVVVEQIDLDVRSSPPDDDSPRTAGEPDSPPQSAPAPPDQTTVTTTTSTTTTTAPQSQLTARERLDTYLARDRDGIERLVGRWVPQVSAKRVGIEVDGFVYGIDDVLTDHERLRDAYGAVLLWSGDFHYRDGDLWITVVPETYETGDAAVGWCVDHGIDADNCFAKLITRDRSLDSTVVYQ